MFQHNKKKEEIKSLTLVVILDDIIEKKKTNNKKCEQIQLDLNIHKVKESESCSAVSDSLRPHDCSPPGSSGHGDSPGKNTGVGCHALLQGIFPTQGSNPGLPHCRRILYR